MCIGTTKEELKEIREKCISKFDCNCCSRFNKCGDISIKLGYDFDPSKIENEDQFDEIVDKLKS